MYGSSRRWAAQITRQTPLILSVEKLAIASNSNYHHNGSLAPPKDIARSYRTVSTDSKQPRNIAVLGGGLTGLTTAYFLNKLNPNVKITIYEADDRLGGWADTKKVRVKDVNGRDGFVTWDRGPRTIKIPRFTTEWNLYIFYELVCWP